MTGATGAPPPPEEAVTGFGGLLVRYYRLFVLVVVALLAHGIVSFILLPRTEDPEFDSTESRIITLYPGVEAREVETQVTRRLEDAIDELEGIRTIESTSYAGLSLIKITLSDDAQPTAVVKDIREKVRDSSKDLPEGAKEPIVIVLNTAFIPVSIVSLTGPADYKLLEDWSETVRKSLAQLQDVAAVHVEGLPERQLQVNVDNERLSQVRIPLTRIRDILSLENAGIPAGKLDVGTRRFLLRTPNDYDTPESIGATVIGAVGDSIVHLRDVAKVEEGLEDYRYIVRTNRKPAALISVRKKDKTNTVWVAERVEQKVAEMAKVLPAGLEMRIINDRGRSVAQLLSGLGQEVWLGGLLVIGCIWFFMGLRQALVVAISIPMCVLMTFSLMYFLSIDLHQISIFGLILALGLVVDASIVVVESIEARLEAGDPLVAAVSNGVGSMAWPIASATFTSIAAFLPMVSLPGIIGDFISATPITVTFALLSSLFVALCVVPLLCFAMWKRWPPVHHAKPEHEGSKKSGAKLLDAYIRTLKFCLRHKFLTLSLAVVSFAISLWAIPRLGIEYFPKADKQMFLINVRLPTEANIDTTDSVARQVEDLLAQEADVRDFTANVGRGSPRVYYSEEPEDENPSYAQFVVNLKSSYGGTAGAYAAKLQERLHQISGASIQTKVLQQGPTAGAPVQLRISGDDLQVLADLARQAKERIQDVPGLVDLRDTLGDKIPRLSMTFDREKAGRLGVDTLSFARTLLMALNGEKASSFRGSEDEMPLVVRIRKGTFKEVSDLTRLYVPSQTGAMVPFSEVAQIRQEQDFARIGRRDGRRSVIVQADVSGRLVNDVTRDVRERLEAPPAPSSGLLDRVWQALGRGPAPAAAPGSAFSPPLGYQMTIGGENEERDESFRAMGRAMMVGFLLIYAILALEFNSFAQPFVIMLTVPFGIVGSVLGLWIMGYPFGFMAFLGIVGQSGVVITDAIILCDYANYLQRVEGTGMFEALIRAGRERMRPVLVTSATDVVGLLPPMLFGGPLWAPLSTAMCFGLGISTFLTLVILPCLYAVLVRPKEGRRKQRLLSRLIGR